MGAVARGLRLAAVTAGRYGDMLALVSGGLLVLSFAPFGLYWLAPFCLGGLFLSLEGQTPRRAARRGFLFGLASFLFGIYWVYVSIHVFGGAALALALGLMLTLVIFMACYPALFGWLANRFFPTAGWARNLIALPALWVLLEWLRGWLLSGFPWLSVGYSQSDGPISGIVPVLGVFGASAMVAMVAGALVTLAAAGRRRRLPVAIVFIMLGTCAALTRIDFTFVDGEPLTVSLVQGSVPQEIKWLPEQLQPTVNLYMRLTDAHLDSDVIVWPEAAIPTARANMSIIFDALNRRGRETATDFVIGVVEVDRDKDLRLNALLALTHDGEPPGVYYKRHLVPFGEYFPVPSLVRDWIRWLDLPYQDFTAGADDQPLLRVGGRQIGASICYEDVFGEELVGALPDAAFLINVSNDAWFGGSLAPHQHLQIARLRALEGGRELLRATNNGISAAIGADGAVLSVSPQFEEYVLTHRVTPRGGATPYSRWANWPVVSLAVFGLAAVGWRRRRAGA